MNCIGYGAGLFVISGPGGQVFTSPNLTNWTRRSTPDSDDITRIAYGNNTFVIGKFWQAGTLLRSTNGGVTFSNVPTGGAGDRRGHNVCFGNGTFVLPLNTTLRTSVDGATWAETNLNAPNGFIMDNDVVLFDGNRFVGFNEIAANGSTRTIVTGTSTNGVNWSFTTTTVQSARRLYLKGVAPGLIVVASDEAGGSNVFLGTDGATWRDVSGPWSAQRTRSVVFGAGVIVVATDDGFYTSVPTSQDTTAPVVAAHTNVTAEATSAAGAVVAYAAGSATDAVGVTSLTYSQDSGTTFPIGVTTLTITARDAANNVGTGTFTVTVADTTTPVVAAHANVTAEATSVAGAVVTYADGSATDAVGVASLTYSQASGTSFPMGVTTVTITATDAANHTGTGTFTVTVADTTTPVVAAHANVTAEATSAAGAVVTYAAGSATDAVGVTSLTYSQTSGTSFPMGVTTVTITATDAANHTGTGTFTVTVQDTTGPVITLNGAATMVVAKGAAFTDPGATALDAVGGSVTVSVSGSVDTNGVGDYTLTYNAEDAAHNAAAPVTRTVTVYLSAVSVDDVVTATTGTTRVYPLANDTDPGGAALSLVSTTGPGTITADGRSLVIPAGYTGTFSYTATNGAGPSSANVTVIAGTPATARKQWSGLLYDSNGTIAGWMRASRTLTGHFSYVLKVGMARSTGRFLLDARNAATVGALTVTEDTAHRLAISVVDGGETLTGSLRQSVPNATPRQYNLALAGAERAVVSGGGILRAFVKATGSVNLIGTMPDGKSFTVASLLADNGSIVFYGSPLRTQPAALVVGELTLGDLAATDVTGELAWVKPAQVLSTSLYGWGVNTVLTANGCIYSVGAPLPNGASTLTLAGGSLATDISTETIATAGKPTPTLSLPSWKVQAERGTFIAMVKYSARLSAVRGTGLYLPKSHSAWGYFPGTMVGGRIVLTQP